MENDYNFFDNAPANFSLCFKSECASAGECLRELAGRDLSKERVNLTIINPLLTDTAGESACKFFRHKPVADRHGWGVRLQVFPESGESACGLRLQTGNGSNTCREGAERAFRHLRSGVPAQLLLLVAGRKADVPRHASQDSIHLDTERPARFCRVRPL